MNVRSASNVMRDQMTITGMPDIHRWRPAERAKRIVIALHGVRSHAGWFHTLAAAMCELGIEFWGIDRRGSGAARDAAGADDPALLIDDTHEAVRAARQQVDHVTLLGWCWGARAALIATAQGCPISELVLAAPALSPSPNDELQRRRQRILAQSTSEDALTNPRLPLPIDADLFSEDPEVVRYISEDPLAWRDQPSRFPPRSQELLSRAIESIPKLTKRCLCLLAEHDLLINNEKTKALLGSHQIVVLPGGHAIILETPARIASCIRDWLAESPQESRHV